MAWQLITAQTLIPAREIITSTEVNASAVIIRVDNLRAIDPGDWYRAGFVEQIYQSITDPGDIGDLTVKNERVKLSEAQLIYLDNSYLPCKLRFTPVDWLAEIQVRMWRLT